jgi:GxxExxY protein
MALALKKRNIPFKEQVDFRVKFDDTTLGKGFPDFVVDDKVIVEVKKRNNFSPAHIKQIFGYLKASALKLCLIINFGSEGVRHKRVTNLKPA